MNWESLEVDDGTRLAAYQFGTKGPGLVLANGLGGNILAWQHLIDFFEPNYNLHSWDYRGLYNSVAPIPKTAVSVESHARDMLALMDDAGLESAVCIGWSMGCQVILDLYRQAPERVSGIVLICGAPGRALQTSMGGGHMGPLVRQFVESLHELEPHWSGLVSKTAPLAVLLPWLKYTGLISHCADLDIMRAQVAAFLELDFDLYLSTLSALDDHEARAVLPHVNVPTLIIGGDSDMMTPASVSQEMHHAIPGSELLIIRAATHYAPIEFPEYINLRIEKFLIDHQLASDKRLKKPKARRSKA